MPGTLDAAYTELKRSELGKPASRKGEVVLYAGTSYEGVRWRVKDQNRTQFNFRISRRVRLVLLATSVVVSAMLALLLTSPQAQAHFGVSCTAVAYKPYPVAKYKIGGHGAGYCTRSGYSHYRGLLLYKNINNWPDRELGKNGFWSTRAQGNVYLTAYGQGGGEYYTIAWVRFHDDSRSYPYYRNR